MKRRILDLALEGEIERTVKMLKRRAKLRSNLCEPLPTIDIHRDKAWEKLIQRRDIALAFDEYEYGFPADQGWHLLWCVCWEMAYQKGLEDGRKQS